MKKNNKGFTLIELLAVIVVLAIIMVIATTQINRTIKKSRADSFVSSYQLLYKSLKSGATQNLSVDDIKTKVMDYSDKEFNVALTETSGVYTLAVCTAGIDIDVSTKTESNNGTGKFANMDLTEYYESSSLTGGDDGKRIGSIGNSYSVTKHCIISTYSS